ncbi:putative Cytochrome P450 [Seiridium cardinale]|uniref:Cytochrome P450 n=1 Tax=Seiridium cardinale TaxID=138064 RepID=A0ABR2XV72_9PEZI
MGNITHTALLRLVLRGCEPAGSHQAKEPFFGLDFQSNMYGDVPFLYRLHQRYSNTYQVRSWISLPTVCIIATENLRTINASKDFGVEPMRLSGLAYFCGRGFIMTDGNTWNHSRKLLKPSFDLSNIRNLTTLRREVDHLIEELPKDTSAIDLQAPLYVMFLNSALHFVLGVHPSEDSFGAPLTADEFVRAFHDALFYSMTNDPEFIRNQVIQAMMAAQDTTSELLTNALFLFARHPKYWQQLRSEFVDRSEDDLSVESLRGSKSIENVLHETLRLHPISPLLGRVALRDTKLPIGGGPHHDRPMFIPKGSPVVMGYYALYRNPEVFGEDVEAFRPERWNSIKPAQWDFLGFGGGNRACLRQQKAMLEASYVLARLSQAIEKLTSADGREWKEELKLTCKSANGCKVRVH